MAGCLERARVCGVSTGCGCLDVYWMHLCIHV